MVRNRVFQVSSTDLMTHYEFAKLYTKAFSHSDSLITKGKWNFPLLNYIEMSLLEEMRFEMDLSNMESFFSNESTVGFPKREYIYFSSVSLKHASACSAES